MNTGISLLACAMATHAISQRPLGRAALCAAGQWPRTACRHSAAARRPDPTATPRYGEPARARSPHRHSMTQQRLGYPALAIPDQRQGASSPCSPWAIQIRSARRRCVAGPRNTHHGQTSPDPTTAALPAALAIRSLAQARRFSPSRPIPPPRRSDAKLPAALPWPNPALALLRRNRPMPNSTPPYYGDAPRSPALHRRNSPVRPPAAQAVGKAVRTVSPARHCRPPHGAASPSDSPASLRRAYRRRGPHTPDGRIPLAHPQP